MPTANVSVRLSIQDAETVRSALEKLGTDGQAALKKLEAASGTPSAGLSAIDKGVKDVKSRFDEMAQSLGPVGSLLMGLGPIGVGVAAGLGAAVLILHEMSKAANELGERSASLRNFASSAGVTTTVIQALSAEGSKFGVGNEQIATGLSRLAVNLDAAKRGTGALYEDLHRINPELAHQVAAAHDVAAAYDVIGRAIRDANAANNSSGAAAIARAAFGRDASAQGNLAASVSAQGGTNSLATTFTSAGKAIDDGLIKHLAELKTQIDETNQRAKDMGASIFAEDVLQRELQAAQAMERMAAATKDMASATKDESWGQWFARHFSGAGAEGGVSVDTQEQVNQNILENAARRRLASGLTQGVTPASQKQSGLGADDFNARFAGGDNAVAKTGDAAKAAAVPVEVLLEDMRKWMAVLGAAATPAERLRMQLLQLSVAVKENNADTAIATRARQELNDSYRLEITSARERLGLATQEEVLTAKLIELKREERAAGVQPGSPQDQQAQQRAQLSAQEQFRNEQVANSAYKGLASLAQPDLYKNIDSVASSSLDKLGSTLVELEMHTRTGKQAWREWGLSVIQSIESVVVKSVLLAPIAAMLNGALPGGGGAAAGGIFGGSGFLKFADGGIMTSMGSLPLNRYAAGGVADRPQLAMFGEGRGPEAYVPLPDGRAIPVALQGRNGGGHQITSQLNVTYHAPPGGQDDGGQQAKKFAAGVRDMVGQAVDERILRHLQSGGMLNQ